MTAQPDPRQRRAELAIVATACIWGSTFVLTKDALEGVSPLVFLAVRFTIGALLLAAVLNRRLRWQRGAGRAGMITSGLLFLGYALQTFGLRLTSASKSAFLTSLYIVLVPFLGSLVFKTRPAARELGGAILAVAGTALMSMDKEGFRLGWGDLLTLACAVAFAGHLLAVERFSRQVDYRLLSAVQVAGVAVLSMILAPVLETPTISFTRPVALGIGVTAVFATAFAFLLYTWAQSHTSANRAAILFSAEPVFAGWLGWAAYGERWTAWTLAGAAAILTGILIVELKPRELAEHQFIEHR